MSKTWGRGHVLPISPPVRLNIAVTTHGSPVREQLQTEECGYVVPVVRRTLGVDNTTTHGRHSERPLSDDGVFLC